MRIRVLRGGVGGEKTVKGPITLPAPPISLPTSRNFSGSLLIPVSRWKINSIGKGLSLSQLGFQRCLNRRWCRRTMLVSGGERDRGGGGENCRISDWYPASLRAFPAVRRFLGQTKLDQKWFLFWIVLGAGQNFWKLYLKMTDDSFVKDWPNNFFFILETDDVLRVAWHVILRVGTLRFHLYGSLSLLTGSEGGSRSN